VAQRRRSQWQRHFFHQQESVKTTWKFRIAILTLMMLLVYSVYSMREVWVRWVGQSLVCPQTIGQSDLILVENFDPDYLVFQRTAELQHAGWATRVLIPIPVATDPGQPDKRPYVMSKGVAELMSKLARIHDPQIFPIRAIEPIRLNAAYQLRDHLTKEHLTSVIVVTPIFESMRSYLVYQAVLTLAGIRVYCVPVSGLETAENWTKSWHDIQEVVEQFLKLLFYRLYVLRNRLAQGLAETEIS
jgi:hypothetical protein